MQFDRFGITSQLGWRLRSGRNMPTRTHSGGTRNAAPKRPFSGILQHLPEVFPLLYRGGGGGQHFRFSIALTTTKKPIKGAEERPEEQLRLAIDYL